MCGVSGDGDVEAPAAKGAISGGGTRSDAYTATAGRDEATGEESAEVGGTSAARQRADESTRFEARIIAANVGGLFDMPRTEGSGVGRATGGAVWGPNQRAEAVCAWMAQSSRGHKLNVILVLSETQLLGRLVGEFQALALANGYEAECTWGVSGGPRGDRAGVCVAWDPNQIGVRPLETGRRSRVVAAGRVLYMRMFFVGGGCAHGDWDIDMYAAYMPPRHLPTKEVEDAWHRLHRSVRIAQRRQKVLIAGDLNAEHAAAMRLRRNGRGAPAKPGDHALQSITEEGALTRLHGLETTRRIVRNGREEGTIIDHMFAGPLVEARVTAGSARTVEGVTFDHMALSVVIDTGKRGGGTGGAAVPTRQRPGPMCHGGAAGAACRAIFAERAWTDWAAVRDRETRSSDGQLTAFQISITRSMTYAVRGAALGDVQQQLLVDKEEAWREGEVRRGRRVTADPRDSAATQEVRVHTVRAALTARLAALAVAPTSISGWRSFLSAGRRGLPSAYVEFSPRTDVAIAMRRIYGRAFAMGLMRDGDRGAAGESDARSIALVQNVAGLRRWKPAYEGSSKRGRTDDDSGIMVCQLLLAWRRRHEEMHELERHLERIVVRNEEMHEADSADYYVRRVHAARLRGGGVMAVVYSIASMAAGLPQLGKKSKDKSGTPLTMLRAGDVEGGELLYQPVAVLQAAREFAVRMNVQNAYSIAGCEWLLERGGIRRASAPSADRGDWIDRVFTMRSLDRVLRQMRPAGQAVGKDGFVGATIRWAPRSMQREYLAILKEAVRACADNGQVPKSWPEWLVKMIPKKDRDAALFANMRDIWMVVHSWKIVTGMFAVWYDLVADTVVPWLNAGFRSGMAVADVAAVASHHAGQVHTTGAPLARTYVDRRGFFMGVPRPVSFHLESYYGVEAGITATIRAVQNVVTGQVDTAYGLTEPFQCTSGTGQGCKLGPTRSMLPLVVTQTAITSLVPGFRFEVPHGAQDWLVSCLFFADDNNMPATDMQGLQLGLDVEDVSSLVSGNVVAVDAKGRPTKTACMYMTMEHDGRVACDVDVQLTDGAKVPMVTDTYGLLGSEVGAYSDNDKVVAYFRQKVSLAYSMLGRVGALDVRGWTLIGGAVAVGLADFYGASTPIGYEVAERCERAARSALFGIGARGKLGPRLQVYAPFAWGGMGRLHTFATTGAAIAVQMDRALSARPGEPQGHAVQSEIALTAHRLGCVPTEDAPSPLDCDFGFAYDAGGLRWGHVVESWIIVLGHARVRARYTGANRGTRQPLDGGLPAWSPPTPLDGGGPAVWTLTDGHGGRIRYSSRLAALGVVRLVDVYGGRDAGGAPRWRTWEETQAYYVVQCGEPQPAWLQRVRREYEQLMVDLAGQREACQWLSWYDEMALGRLPEEAAGVALRLAAMRDGWPVSHIVDVKDSGIAGDDDPDYLVHWHGLDEQERSWEGTSSVLHHWRVHQQWSDDRARRADAVAAMATARAAGVAPFHFRTAAERGLGEGVWSALRSGAPNRLEGRDEQVVAALQLLEQHARRVSAPRSASMNLVDDRERVATLEWTVESAQTFFGGQLTRAPLGDGVEAARRRTARAEAAIAADLGDDGADGDDAGRGGVPVTDAADEAYAPWAVGELWPPHLAVGRGRVPSLAPRDADERERVAAAAAPVRADVSDLRMALERGGGSQRWRWADEDEAARYRDDPVVRVLQAAANMLPSWHAAGSGQPTLYRGLSSTQLAMAVAGGGMPAAAHSGDLREHIEDIESGSGRVTRGLSLTKDPFIAVAYAGDGSRAVCAAGGVIEASGHGHDFSTVAGHDELQRAGASAQVLQFVTADAEYRIDRALMGTALVHSFTSGLLMSPPIVFSGTGSKASLWQRLRREDRDAVIEWAAECEGRQAARLSPGEPRLRLDWAEVRALDDAADLAVGHMALTLHAQHAFTDACATDGSLVDGGPYDTGRAAYGVWHGENADGSADGEGGAMEAGSTIADAELVAVARCVRRAGRRADESRRAPRVLLLGDSHSVLWAVEKAWRSGSAWRLRSGHRQGLLEAICLERRRWQVEFGGGTLVTLWVPSHAGITANGAADAIAKAYVDEAVRGDIAPSRRASLVEYSMDIAPRPDTQSGRVYPGVWVRQAASRAVRGLFQRRLNEYVVRDLQVQPGADAGARRRRSALLLDEPAIGGGRGLNCGTSVTQGKCWSAVVRATSESRDSGGHRGLPTRSGAVMRMRSDQLGVATDEGYDEMQLPRALSAVWAADTDSGGSQAAADVMGALAVIASAVAHGRRAGKGSAFHGAVAEATAVFDKLRAGRVDQVTAAEWRSTRRVAGGLLPEPSRAEWAATDAVYMLCLAPPAAGDGPPVGSRAAATATVRDAVWDMARAAAVTAAEWRRRYAEGQFDGMRDEDDDEDERHDEEADGANDASAEDSDQGGAVTEGAGGSASGGAGHAAAPAARAQRVRLVVAGAPGSERASRRASLATINILRGGGLGNPFPMGTGGRTGAWRDACVDAHRRWLMAGSTPAGMMRMPDGTALPSELRPRRREAQLTGDDAMQALVSQVDALATSGGEVTVVLGCSAGCRDACAAGAMRACHGQALVERYVQQQADNHAAAAAQAVTARRRARQEAAAAPAAARRHQRPRRLLASEAGAGTIGYVSLLRFRHGSVRQAPTAVRWAMLADPAPWMRKGAQEQRGGRADDERSGEWLRAAFTATDGDSGMDDGDARDDETSTAGEHDGWDEDGEGRVGDGDAAGGGGCTEEAGERGDRRVVEHVQGAGGDVDGRLDELMTAAAEGTAVVYEEQPPPPAGTPTDGVPEGEEAAAQRRGWLNDERDDELFETLRAVSSGAYALQPIRLEDGELTPFEEAVAGIVARASPASASSIRVGASRGRSSAEALSTPEADAPTPVRGDGRGSGTKTRAPRPDSRKRRRSRARADDDAHSE